MDDSHDYKLNDTCRICLLKTDNMRNIMETNQHNSNIILMLQSIGHFEIVLNDFLPKYLCRECENKLELSYDFQKTVQKSNEHIMKYFNEQFCSKINDSNYRNLETKIEIPKEEPPDSIMYDQTSQVSENELSDETNECFGDETKVNIHNGDRDPLEIKSDLDSPISPEDSSLEDLNNSLPAKSAKTYEKFYSLFMKWRKTNKIDNFSENTLFAYFDELSKKLKCTSLWTRYSILKSILSMKHKTDISKYDKLSALLKRKSEGYMPKKAKTFSTTEIKQFIDEAPDIKYLLLKVACIFGIIGACRRRELHKLEYDDVTDFSSTLLVKIKDPKSNSIRKFTVMGKYYEICKKYINLRPENCTTSAFFLNYFNGKCTAQNVGINKFGNMGKVIATFLRLPNPNLYTGHCFRRSSATMLVDECGDITSLKRPGRLRPTTTAPTENDVNQNQVNGIQNNGIIIMLPTIFSVPSSNLNKFD